MVHFKFLLSFFHLNPEFNSQFKKLFEKIVNIFIYTMLKILVSLIALSKQLDIYLLTDGPGWTTPDADYEKLNWKRAKSWIEFLFDRSALLEQSHTNLYFISR